MEPDRPEGKPPEDRSRGCRKGPVKVAYEGFETMSRVPSLSSPFLLGFDEIERALDRVAKAADGYPPYNIERIARENGQPERLRITLAVAGFTRDQLDVTVEESQLVIRGRQQDDKARHYLHRGIAARQFQRTFVLADGMEVLGADLKNGLLSIDLARPEPERIVRTISITRQRLNPNRARRVEWKGVECHDQQRHHLPSARDLARGAGAARGRQDRLCQDDSLRGRPQRQFPQAPQLAPGTLLYALHAADGTPIMLTDSREAAVANAWSQELETVSVH